MKLYSLEHIRYYKNNDYSDQKAIGIYSDRDLAEKKIRQYSQKEGFINHPEGFSIQEITVNQGLGMKKIKNLWILQHVTPYQNKDYDFIRTLGIYSTKGYAQNMKNIFKSKSPFNEYPRKFYIGKVLVDIDGWTAGFIDD